MTKPAAVVFDLDGTLVLTESRNRLVWQRFLGRYGIALDDELAVQLTGRRGCDSLGDLTGLLPARPTREYLDELDEIDEALPLVPEEVPGAIVLVRRLAAAGVRLALVTSARRRHAGVVLQHLGLVGAFDVVVTAEDVEVGKPDPQGYLLACRRLDVLPESAIGVEDSAAGVAAVKAAGMTCVAVTTTTPGAALVGADLLVEHFLDITQLGWPVLHDDAAVEGLGIEAVDGGLRPTERRSERTRDLDLLGTAELVRLLAEEEAAVVPAVSRVVPQIARLVDLAVAALSAGGRVHYVGAATSGRIATLDAAELPGTYGVPPDWFLAHHAGGPAALAFTAEDVEDDQTRGEADLVGVTAADLVIGVTASGRTPYVLGALRRARAVGALTALITADPAAAAGEYVDVYIGVDTGPEPVTGSTRMKAASAQKLVLTTFSTAVMVRLGQTYSNLMVGVVASNAKLRVRALRILLDATGADAASGEQVLQDAAGDLRVALVTLLADVPVERARAAVDVAGGRVREALAQLQLQLQLQRERR